MQRLEETKEVIQMEKVGEQKWAHLASWFDAPEARVIARLQVYIRKMEKYELVCYHIPAWNTYAILRLSYECGEHFIDREPDILYVNHIPKTVVKILRKKRGNKKYTKWDDLFSVRTEGFNQLQVNDLFSWDQASPMLSLALLPELSVIIGDYFVSSLYLYTSKIGSTYYSCTSITKDCLPIPQTIISTIEGSYGAITSHLQYRTQ